MTPPIVDSAVDRARRDLHRDVHAPPKRGAQEDRTAARAADEPDRSVVA